MHCASWTVTRRERGRVRGASRIGALAALAILALTAWYTAASASRALTKPRVLAKVRVGSQPLGLTFGAGAVWAANYGSHDVARIDTGTNRSPPGSR